jgi:hypothetical protein
MRCALFPRYEAIVAALPDHDRYPLLDELESLRPA